MEGSEEADLRANPSYHHRDLNFLKPITGVKSKIINLRTFDNNMEDGVLGPSSVQRLLEG